MATREDCRAAFSGKRILIATDESLIAAMLAGKLRTLGFAEVRTETTLAGSWSAIGDFKPDVALLDITLSDGPSLTIAQVLAIKRVPSVFMSEDVTTASSNYLRHIVLQKPLATADLRIALSAALAATH